MGGVWCLLLVGSGVGTLGFMNIWSREKPSKRMGIEYLEKKVASTGYTVCLAVTVMSSAAPKRVKTKESGLVTTS